MDVKDRLAGVAIAVEDRSIAALLEPAVTGEARRPAHHFSNQPVLGRRQLVEGGDVPPGKNEHVERRLRIDVLNDHEALVLMDDRRGDVACDDLAEKTVRHGEG